MKIIASFLLISSTYLSLATDKPIWHNGSIVSANREVRVGKIAIHPAFDLIIFQDSSGIKTYSAHQLSSLRFYDENLNINRKYISVGDPNFQYTKFRLYEVVFNSDIKVVRRISSLTADPGNDRDGYDYYVLFEQSLVPFHQFDKKIFPILNARLPELGKIIAENNLSVSKAADIIPVIRLYLARSEKKVASQLL